jgi:hypothetical protein
LIGKLLAGFVKLQAPQQGGFAAARCAEKDHRPLGNIAQDVAQVEVVFFLLLELQGLLAAQHVQQPQADETDVDLVAFGQLAQQRLAIASQCLQAGPFTGVGGPAAPGAACCGGPSWGPARPGNP